MRVAGEAWSYSIGLNRADRKAGDFWATRPDTSGHDLESWRVGSKRQGGYKQHC
jgi:hypothetical protein